MINEVDYPLSKRKRGSTSNSFAFLANDDDDEESETDNLCNNNETAKKKHDFVHTLCKAGGITKYCIKTISIGIKAFCLCEDDYNKLIQMLTECMCEFFTHDRKGDRMFKVVLYGLKDQPADMVKHELGIVGYSCNKVKLGTKKYDHGQDTLYIVSFPSGSIKLSDLNKKIPVLFHTLVRWNFHKKPKGSMVQCRKCQMFGHGERGYRVNPKCVKCAGPHKNVSCQLGGRALCCTNCKGNHLASDRTCPNRAEFAQLRKRLQLKARKQATYRPRKAFTYSSEHIPPLHATSRISMPVANAVIRNHPASSPRANAWTDRNNLFFPEEISRLTIEVISSPKNCSPPTFQLLPMPLHLPWT